MHCCRYIYVINMWTSQGIIVHIRQQECTHYTGLTWTWWQSTGPSHPCLLVHLEPHYGSLQCRDSPATLPLELGGPKQCIYCARWQKPQWFCMTCFHHTIGCHQMGANTWTLLSEPQCTFRWCTLWIYGCGYTWKLMELIQKWHLN